MRSTMWQAFIHRRIPARFLAVVISVVLVIGLMPAFQPTTAAYADQPSDAATVDTVAGTDTVAVAASPALQGVDGQVSARISADEQEDIERMAAQAAEAAQGESPQSVVTPDIIAVPTAEEDGFQWEITSGGQLVISPLDGEEVGQLGDYYATGDAPWSDYATGIVSVRFDGTVKAGAAMNYMFYGASSLVYVFNPENLDTSACTSMSNMFALCSSLLSVDLSTWDVSHVTDMSQMFYNCPNLTSVTTESEDGTSGWNEQTMVCESFNSMFYYCDALAEVTPTNWVTASTTDVYRMFSWCRDALTTLDCSGWDTSGVEDMSFLFTYCLSLEELTIGDAWDTSNVTTMESLFSSCLVLDFDAAGLSKAIANWDVSNVTSTREMYYRCSGLNSFDGWTSGFAPSRYVDAMFIYCANVESIDVSGWDVSRIGTFDSMFSGCSSLTKIAGLDTWENDSCTYFTCMFQECSNLTSITLNMAGHASSFSGMFNGCTLLEELYIPNITTYNASGTASFVSTFDGCDNLRTIQIGERFNFYGAGTSTTYVVTFPTPTFATATGLWVSKSTGAVYTPDAIPNTTADTYIAQESDVPIIESGDGQTAVQGDDLVFVVMCFGDGIESVAVDDTVLGSSDYTIARSSNKRIVTVANAYIQTLEPGQHTITITCSNGSVNGTFTVPEASWAGTGTEDDPYLISNYAELELLATSVNNEGKNFEDTYFSVTADIDATHDAAGAAVNWQPIGNSSATMFSGTFMGNEHTITVDINRSDESQVGLFGAVAYATITGVVVDGTIVGGNDVAGIVGYIGSTAYSTSDATTIRYCGNRASISGGSVASNGDARVGGIVGYSYNQLSIISCYNRGSVTNVNTNTNTSSFVGGMIGNAYNTTIESCYNRGDITSNVNSTSYNYTGGLLGMGNGSCVFEHSYSTGTITSNGRYTGALAGSLINAYYHCENGDSAYLEGSASCAVGTDGDNDANGITYRAYQPLSSAALKAYDFGDEFVADDNDNPINDGYPHLVWEGTGDIPTVRIIYDIYTPDDMWEFASAVRYGHSYSGETVTVYADIDLDGKITDMNTLDGENLWTPIESASTVGAGSSDFAGTFDGGGHTISNMVITTGSYMGLFAQLSSGGVVKDVTVSGEIYAVGSYVGSIVGWNHGTVEGCTSNVEVNTYSCSYVGGIVADNDGNILNCTNNGNVGDAYSSYVGGIAGHDEPYYSYDYSVIAGCENNGDVVGYQYVGGITGGVWDGYIYCCVNNGNVTGYMTNIGGLVGDAAGGYYVVIENCANNGIITGSNYNVGSLAGRIQYSGYLSYCYYLTGTCSSVVGTVTGSVYGNTEVSEPVATVEDVHWCQTFTDITDEGHAGICYYCGANFSANHIYAASDAGQHTRTCVVCGYEHSEGINIEDCTVVLSEETFTYDGTAHTPDVIVTDGSTMLVLGDDYTLSVEGNVDAGTATITITGKGDYYGTITRTFTIEPRDAVIVCNSASKTEGEADPELTGTVSGLVNDDDLGVVSYVRDAGESVGTYAIMAEYTPNTNYNVTIVAATFTIVAASEPEPSPEPDPEPDPGPDPEPSPGEPITIDAGMFTVDTTDVTYTGSPIEKAIEPVDSELVAGVDYEVTYANNISAGEATITIVGLEPNYTGEVTYTFTIKRAFTRLAGDDRYSTMEAEAEEAFESADTVVLTTGSNFPDALAASGLAGTLGAPIVLTTTDELSPEAAEEIARLGASKVYVVGGTASVSDAVVSALAAQHISVTRIAGDDRYDTALKAYGAGIGTWGDTAIIASGTSFPDTLSASSYAWWADAPIFLTSTSGLDEATREAIAAGGFERIIIVGGTASVPITDEAWAQEVATTLRLSGADRYATSAAFATWAAREGMSFNDAAIATGTNFPDALVGGALCGVRGSVLLLADMNATDGTAAIDVLADHKNDVSRLYYLGGVNSVTPELAAYIEDTIG